MSSDKQIDTIPKRKYQKTNNGMKESSFKKLYSTATGCGLFLDNEKLVVKPYKCIDLK